MDLSHFSIILLWFSPLNNSSAKSFCRLFILWPFVAVVIGCNDFFSLWDKTHIKRDLIINGLARFDREWQKIFGKENGWVSVFLSCLRQMHLRNGFNYDPSVLINGLKGKVVLPPVFPFAARLLKCCQVSMTFWRGMFSYEELFCHCFFHRRRGH